MKKTTNYQLNQWEKTDGVLMADFNADNAKLEAALTALSAERVAVGSYVGDGASSRVIPLPFAAKFVIVFGHIDTKTMLGVFTNGDCRYVTNDSCGGGLQYNLLLQGDKLVVQHADWNNAADRTVTYIAVR